MPKRLTTAAAGAALTVLLVTVVQNAPARTSDSSPSSVAAQLTTSGTATTPRGPDATVRVAPTTPPVPDRTGAASRGAERDQLPSAEPAEALPIPSSPPASATRGQAPKPAPTVEQASSTATGISPDISLSPMDGGTIAASDTTITDTLIDGDAVFTGDNVTLRNVRITGKVLFRGDNVTLESSEFGALSLSGTDTVRITGVEIVGATGSDGIHITSDTGQVRDVVISTTWIHSPKVTSNSHYDGIQVRGVDGLTLDNVIIDLGEHKPQYNAALFLQDANGGTRNITITGSQIRGGGYAFYAFADDVRITNTMFGDAAYGHLYPKSRVGEIVEFSGNTTTSGTPLRISGSEFR